MAVPDKWVTQIATNLLNCLCTTLAADPYTPVCRCCLRTSQTLPPMDACDCACTVGDPPVEGNGEAWVRVVRTYPVVSSTGISRNPAVCGPGLMGVEFQLGIYRCIKGVPDEDGSPPDCDTITNDAVLIMADQGAMRRAVMCCDALEPFDPVLGEWRPVGPLGGCAGGVMTVSITRMP